MLRKLVLGPLWWPGQGLLRPRARSPSGLQDSTLRLEPPLALRGDKPNSFGFLDPIPTWSWGSLHTDKQFLDANRVSENSTQL